MIRSYDAHIYYPLNAREKAQALRDKADAELAGVKVYKLVDRNVGPHPMPMFEIQFLPSKHYEVVTWLLANRGDLAVLVHENTGNDTRDHAEGAFWMGKVLELDFSKLDPTQVT